MDVETCLMMRQDHTRFIRVKVRSRMREGVAAQSDVDHQGTDERTVRAVAVQASLCAEHLNKNLRDQFDVIEVARAAVELARETIREAELAS